MLRKTVLECWTLIFSHWNFRYFTTAEGVKHAKDALTKELEKMEQSLRLKTEAAESPAKKTPRLEVQAEASSSGRQSILKGVFEKILQEQGDGEAGGASSTSSQVQMHTYLSQKTIPQNESPFQYWSDNKSQFPTLAATAAKFLCAPSTSVDSERLFSVASNIIDAKRNRLDGERAEMLIFLKKNLPLLMDV